MLQAVFRACPGPLGLAASPVQVRQCANTHPLPSGRRCKAQHGPVAWSIRPAAGAGRGPALSPRIPLAALDTKHHATPSLHPSLLTHAGRRRAAACRRLARRVLARQGGQMGAVATARLGARQRGAAAGRAAAKAVGPGGGDRQQAGRAKHHRCAGGGPRGGRRLHVLLRHHGRAGHQPAAVQDPALRPAKRLCAGGLHRPQCVCGAGRGQLADQVDGRFDRPVQGRARQIEPGQRRPAHLQRPDRPAAECPHPGRRQPGGVFVGGHRHARPDRRPCRCDGGRPPSRWRPFCAASMRSGLHRPKRSACCRSEPAGAIQPG